MFIDTPIADILVPVSFTGLSMWNAMHSAWIVMHTLLLKGVLHVDCNHLMLHQFHDH